LLSSVAGVTKECDVLVQIAERRAELLRYAQRYDAEGLHGIADQLRRRAQSLDLQRPLVIVLPAVEHQRTNEENAFPRLVFLPPEDNSITAIPRPQG
jgi:hypothetical protein